MVIAHSVDNGQERRPHDPNSDPAIFTVVLLVVVLFDPVGIDEHARGYLEAHPMLALVRQVLVLIPRESQRSARRVATQL